jgi:hypothetical protein
MRPKYEARGGARTLRVGHVVLQEDFLDLIYHSTQHATCKQLARVSGIGYMTLTSIVRRIGEFGSVSTHTENKEKILTGIEKLRSIGL